MADDESGWTELDGRRGPARSGEQRGTGLSKWSLLLLVLAIALAVILGQNTEPVDVEVLWASFEAPLFLVVLLTSLGLTVLWEVGTLALRHRRRRARRG
ncbi:MAG: LapA family protein [Acidimicrobiales bacterium]